MQNCRDCRFSNSETTPMLPLNTRYDNAPGLLWPINFQTKTLFFKVDFASAWYTIMHFKQKNTQNTSVSSVFAHLDRRVSFHILAGRLSSNSCSAALICVFCATRRIRFFVSDLFQKRPSWRGRAVAGPLCLSKKRKKNVMTNRDEKLLNF